MNTFIFNIKNRQRGFTVIELLVVTGIFALLSGALLANYPQFSSRIVLENTAQEVALSLRQAQTYGLSVRGFEGSSQVVFPGYGMYFIDPVTDNKTFTLFADEDGDKLYNKLGCSLADSECLDRFTIQSNNRIYALCTDLKNDGVAPFETIEDVQNAGSSCGEVTELHVTYTRPDPDAVITGRLPNGSFQTYTDGEIVIASPRNEVRTIVVWTTGQIAVE